jgi:hypothetical protein
MLGADTSAAADFGCAGSLPLFTMRGAGSGCSSWLSATVGFDAVELAEGFVDEAE